MDNVRKLKIEYSLFEVGEVPSREIVSEKIIQCYNDYLDISEFDLLGKRENYSRCLTDYDELAGLRNKFLGDYCLQLSNLEEALNDDNVADIYKLLGFATSKFYSNLSACSVEVFYLMLKERFGDESYFELGEAGFAMNEFFAEEFKRITKRELFVKEKK